MSFFRIILLVICLFANTMLGFSQNSTTIDSLKGVLAKTRKDTSRIGLYIRLSKEDTVLSLSYADSAISLSVKNGQLKYQALAHKNKAEALQNSGNNTEAIRYYKEAAVLFNQSGNIAEVANINFKQGILYYYLNDYQKSLEYHQKSLKYREEIQDSAGILSSEQGVASMYWRMGNLKPAGEHYKKALEVSEKINDSTAVCAILNSLGAVYWGFGDYITSLEYYEKALNIALKVNFRIKYVLIINNIGLIYQEWGNNEKAMDSYREGLHIAKKEEYLYGLAYSYSNMGELFRLNDKYQTALAYFDSALVNYNEIGKQNGIAFCYRNIGNAYKGLKNFPKAIKYYQLSINSSKEIDSKQHLAMALTALASVFFEIKNYQLAAENAKQSLEISLEYDYKDISKDNYFLLSELAEQSGSYMDALDFFKKGSIYKDSIFNEKSSSQIAEMQTRYETEKKERENLNLRREEQVKNLKLESNKTQIRFQSIVIFTFALLLIMVVVLAIRLNKNRKDLLKSKNQLTLQNNEINTQKEELYTQQENLKEVNSLLQIQAIDLETSKKELQEKVEELKKATDFKNRIFSIIGHDLRGPIGTISSILSLAMEDQLSEEKRQLMLSLTKESAVATYSLLENLLIWANNEQGDISYNSQNLYFRELVQDNVNLLKEKASEKSIELFLEIEKSLQVYADYNTVDTIVRNLLSNALKFTYKNGRIEISAINKNGFVEISVVDNGIGIGAANLKKILDTDIHYTDRGTHGEKGSGLGLALCFEFIKMNKGSYQIHSQEGQGTRFVFTLPGAVNQ